MLLRDHHFMIIWAKLYLAIHHNTPIPICNSGLVYSKILKLSVKILTPNCKHDFETIKGNGQQTSRWLNNTVSR